MCCYTVCYVILLVTGCKRTRAASPINYERKFSKVELRADFRYLRSILEQEHPGELVHFERIYEHSF
jgi:hypothetical protein